MIVLLVSILSNLRTSFKLVPSVSKVFSIILQRPLPKQLVYLKNPPVYLLIKYGFSTCVCNIFVILGIPLNVNSRTRFSNLFNYENGVATYDIFLF